MLGIFYIDYRNVRDWHIFYIILQKRDYVLLSSVYGWDKGLEKFLVQGHAANLQAYPISTIPTLSGG